MRLAGIPIESKFYAVIARGLFEYSGAAGLGAGLIHVQPE
jgi:hypothetical protein